MNGQQQMQLLPPPPPPPPDMMMMINSMINDEDKQRIMIRLKELDDENQLLRQQLNENNKINSNKGIINLIWKQKKNKNIFDLLLLLFKDNEIQRLKRAIEELVKSNEEKV
jgi:hypothetical protein